MVYSSCDNICLQFNVAQLMGLNWLNSYWVAQNRFPFIAGQDRWAPIVGVKLIAWCMFVDETVEVPELPLNLCNYLYFLFFIKMQIHQNIGKEFILIFIRCKYVIKLIKSKAWNRILKPLRWWMWSLILI
jgi:hypothetical protein